MILSGTAALITSWIGGRSAVRRLFGGLTRWRIGTGRWALVLLTMPILTIGGAAATGTLHPPDHGWAGEALNYLVLLRNPRCLHEDLTGILPLTGDMRHVLTRSSSGNIRKTSSRCSGCRLRS